MLNLLNPKMVVLGGGIARAGDLLLDGVRRTIERTVFARVDL